MAPHSSTLAWKIAWTEEPGGLPRQFISNIGHLCPSPRDSELTGLGDSLGTRPRIILMGYEAEGHWIRGTCVVMILKGDASISTELWPDEFCTQVAGPLRYGRNIFPY